MSLCARVARNANVGYVTYSGNKQVSYIPNRNVGRPPIPFVHKAFKMASNVSSSFLLCDNDISPLFFQDGVLLCKSTAGMGVPVSVSPNIGARCPFIVFESADIDSAVDSVMEAAFKKRREVRI